MHYFLLLRKINLKMFLATYSLNGATIDLIMVYLVQDVSSSAYNQSYSSKEERFIQRKLSAVSFKLRRIAQGWRKCKEMSRSLYYRRLSFKSFLKWHFF